MVRLPMPETASVDLASVTVTCIIPVYNVEDYLDRCLLSVLGQSRPFDEVILVDDGSTDYSGDLCEKYAAEFSCVEVIHQKNGGLSAARNTGIAAATGQYLSFVDSDDWVTLDHLETLLRVALSSDADIVVGQHLRAKDLEEFEARLGSLGGNPGEFALYSQDEFMRIFMRFEGNRTVHYAWGKLYRRDTIELDHFPVGMLNEDVEGGFKALLNAASVAEVNQCVYGYFLNEKSITGQGIGKNYLNLREVWMRVADIARTRRPDVVPMVDYNVKRADFTMLADMAVHGNFESDRRLASTRRDIQQRLQQNLHALVSGPMPKARKIAMIGLAYAYTASAIILRTVSS